MIPASKPQLHRVSVIAMGIAVLAVLALSGTAAAQATGTFEGTVKNEAGQPVEDANITANGVQIDVESDGTFENDSIPVGEGVTISHPDDDYVEEQFPDVIFATNETTTRDFTLERASGRIDGTVSASSDGSFPEDPIPGATVIVKPTDDADQELIEASDKFDVEHSIDDGDYNIEVPTGDVELTGVREGFTDDTREFSVTKDNTTEPGDIGGPLLEPETKDVTGTITVSDQNNPPIEGATIDATVDDDTDEIAEAVDSADGDFDADEDLNDTTNEDGEYSITVPSGERTVEITADAFETKEIELNDGESIESDLDENFELTHTRPPLELRIDSVTPKQVQSGDEVTVEFTYFGPEDDVDYQIGNEEEICGTDQVTDVDGADEFECTIPDRSEIEDGTYTVTVETPRRTATETITVSNAISPEDVDELGEPLYETPAGDFVEIDTGGEYMLIAGDDDAGQTTQYFDVLAVEDGSTTINTRRIGTDVPSEEAYGDGVRSLAHDCGLDAEPADCEGFEDVSFEDHRGNEIADTLAEFRDEIGVAPRATPVGPDRLRLVAGENGRVMIREEDDVADFRRPAGRSNIDLTYTHWEELDETAMYKLPPGPADEFDQDIGSYLDEATEARTVANGERILIEVPAAGMWGSVIDDPDADDPFTAEEIADVLARPEGIEMDFSIAEYGHPNSRSADLQFEDVAESDLNVILDDSADLWDGDTLGDEPVYGGFYLVIDTRGSDPFTNQPQPEDDLEFTMEYQSPDGESWEYQDHSADELPDPFTPAVPETSDGIEHFPYFGDSQTTVAVNASRIEYQEISMQYDRVRPNGDLLISLNDGQITGATTMAPGSTATMQLIDTDRPDPELITFEDVTVNDDQFFEVTSDFSDLEPGQEVDVEFYAENRLLDNRIVDGRTAHVVEDIENPAQFDITSAPGNVTVAQRQSLRDIEATINNTGEISGRQMVSFRIDNETISEESIIIESGENTTLDLSDQFVTLPVGEYEYTVETDDDEQTGQLTVTPPDSGTEITSADSDAATSESPLGDDELPGDDTDDGLFAFVGVTSRDVAVATAVAGVVHVLGSFT